MNEIKPKYDPENQRAEFAAVVSYHGALVNSRFTIAGLYVAAIGFIANAVFGNDTSWISRVGVSSLACWLTLCLWILELRSRCLYTNLAHRGIEIEHNHWNLKGNNWYKGFFSRQYKEPPEEKDAAYVPEQPALDRPRLGWANSPLSEKTSQFISHSMGLDLLYAGCGIFWLIVLFVSIFQLVK